MLGPELIVQTNMAYLLGAIPAFVIALAAALLLKVRGVVDGVRRGLVWATVVAILELFMAVRNGLTVRFTTPGT